MSAARPMWLIITPVYRPAPGGGAIYTDTLARALAAEGVDVAVATEAFPGQPAVQSIETEAGSVVVHRLFPYRAGRAEIDWRTYRDYARQNVKMLDLPAMLARLAAERGARDAVVLIHSSLFYKPSVMPFILGPLRRALPGQVQLVADVRDYQYPDARLDLLKKFDAICTSSRAVADDLARRMEPIADRLFPIDLPFTGPARPSDDAVEAVLARYGLERGRYLFNPNGIPDSKHYPVMREAMPLVRARAGFEDIILVTAGRARARREADREAEEIGIAKAIGLVPQAEVLALMRGAIGTVVLSDREAISRAALEAMWIGGNAILPNLAEFRQDCPAHVCADVTPEGVAALVAELPHKPHPTYRFERHDTVSCVRRYLRMTEPSRDRAVRAEPGGDKVPARPRVLYSIFDINNQGFLRRLSRLAEAKVPLTILAFSRGTSGAGKAQNLQRLLASADVIDLGGQSKGLSPRRFAQLSRGWFRAIRGAVRSRPFDIVVARNLDMAIIALPFLLRRPRPRFVYEVLDIHPTAWSNAPLARLSRMIERAFLKRADRVIVSTLAFHTQHLGPRMGVPANRICLIENKIAPEQAELVTPNVRGYDRPIRIAYFGKLRCERSIEILTGLVEGFPGEFEVVLAGYPDSIPQERFDRFAALDAVEYRGTFSSVAELSTMIADAHFVWAIDLKHAGANSSWLLPNRLYESVACGLPVLTLEGDASAEYAVARGWGLVLDDLEPTAIRGVLSGLPATEYQRLSDKIRGAARSDYVDTGDIVRLMEHLSSRLPDRTVQIAPAPANDRFAEAGIAPASSPIDAPKPEPSKEKEHRR
jgi:hypothetical protein